MKLTQTQIDVLFHVINNVHGKCFEAACTRANECDGMNYDTFVRTFSTLPALLANTSASDSSNHETKGAVDNENNRD